MADDRQETVGNDEDKGETDAMPSTSNQSSHHTTHSPSPSPSFESQDEDDESVIVDHNLSSSTLRNSNDNDKKNDGKKETAEGEENDNELGESSLTVPGRPTLKKDSDQVKLLIEEERNRAGSTKSSRPEHKHRKSPISQEEGNEESDSRIPVSGHSKGKSDDEAIDLGKNGLDEDKELGPNIADDESETTHDDTMEQDNEEESEVEEMGEKDETSKNTRQDEEFEDNQDEPNRQDDEEELIERPMVQDILVGMGPSLKSHPGNQRMVAIIAVHRDRYDSADKQGKKNLVKEVTSEVHRGGARFLKVNDSGTGWIRCSSKEIRKKVLECLRLGKEDSTGHAPLQIGTATALGASTRRMSGPNGSPSSLQGRNPDDLRAPRGEGSSAELPSTSTGQLLERHRDLLLDPSGSNQLQSLRGLVAGQAQLKDMERPTGVGGIAIQNPGGLVQGPPLRTDVVIGREALLYSQEGNLQLQSLVQANVGQDIIPTDLKKLKAKAILDRMALAGTRFLMKEADGRGLWYHLSDTEAQTVIYRGLCEEERKIQVLLYSSIPPVSSRAGLPFGSENADKEVSHPLLRGSLTQTSASVQPARSEGERREDDPPKKKYKKRLRKVIEERRKLAQSSPKESPSYSSKEGSSTGMKNPVSDGQESSDESSEGSDVNSKKTILTGPIEIRPYDVILGRGRGSFNHSGNKNLINIFRRSKIPYGMASKSAKIQMARDIVADIQSKGGRFLKRHKDNTWEIISNKDAYKKVGHGIRDLREDDVGDEPEKKDSENQKSPKKRAREEEQSNVKKYSKLSKEERGEVVGSSSKFERERSTSSTISSEKNNDVDRTYGKEDGKSTLDESRRSEDEVTMPFKGYEGGLQPRSIDVVCGRGKAFNRHKGNRKMHDVVTKLKYQYRDSTSQEEKSQIAHTVLYSIQGVGGKFLKYDDSKREWEELSYKNALKKIYHSIRDSLYNDRSTNLNDEEIEVTRRADKKRSDNTTGEGKSRRFSGSKKDGSRHQQTKGSVDWKDARDIPRRDSSFLINDQHLLSRHEARMMPGPMGENMRSQLVGTVNRETHGPSHFPLHDIHSRPTLGGAATPLMHQQLMTMGRQPVVGQPWSHGPEQGRMTFSGHESGAGVYQDGLRDSHGSRMAGFEHSAHQYASRNPHQDHSQRPGYGGGQRY